MTEPAPDAVHVTTLAQLMRGGTWRIERPHVRRNHLFIWITQGQGTACLHGVHKGFMMHNALFVPSGSVFALEAGRQVLGQTVHVPHEVGESFPPAPQILRVKDQKSQVELAAIIEAMQTEERLGKPYADAVLAAQTQLLSVWLHRQMLNQPAPARAPKAEVLVRRFCDLVVADFRKGKPMAAYAEALGITPTHLTRVCRQVAGRTAAEILTECLLHEARLTLARSNAPVNEVARGLGFGSPAYFTRFMQLHTQKTPTQLRQSGDGADS